ncbi:MAG: PKD domain-containing protein [bacterium]|nr:PKD domain-containing protein [bacterium]
MRKRMRDFFRKKTWIITTLMFVLAFGLSLIIVYLEFGLKQNVKTTSASSDHNVSGYAWNSNIGWISFNCTNDDPACGASNYGVSIDPASGDFSGYAWSQSVGWVSFNRADTGAPPDQPYKNDSILANYNFASGEISGWAKILAMGDDGWIKLRKFSSDSGPAYGLSVDPATSEVSGWAWNANDNGSGIGWLSFNCSNDSSCGTSAYAVIADVNRPPAAIGLTAPNWSFNEAGQFGALGAKLGWVFSDEDQAASESAYQIIVNTVNNISNPLFDSGKCAGYNDPSASCKINAGVGQFPLDSAMALNYNTRYYWWVKVWDDRDEASVLKQYNTTPDTPLEADDGQTFTFTTYKHELPDVDFSWFPANPSKDEEVKFTDLSQVYLSAAPDTAVACASELCAWAWSATAGATIDDPATSTPTIIFNSAGNSTVTLTVTDNDGYYISKLYVINVNAKLPKWKEVKPE